MTIREWCIEAKTVANQHGFHSHWHNFLERIMLVVTECAEAAEWWRVDDNVKVGEELADVALRLFELAESLGIDLEVQIERKNAINKTRPYRHGGKRA